MLSKEIESPQVNAGEITDPAILNFLRLMGFLPEDHVSSEGEPPIEEHGRQIPPREAVLKVINLLKKV